MSNFEQRATRPDGMESGPKKQVRPMIDQWTEQLTCPQCRNVGMASLSHPEGADVPNVEGVPDGFKAVQTDYGPNFYCGDCDIPAAP